MAQCRDAGDDIGI
ncbi:hypothetical protein PDE_06170 [Penicillium oxalicum 114-2]|uniref:Uncharacterized protein n=1 Tax=Penicillium oxalicum (strain 114-2 / CGMCC 5302) TaxID=933388 RepID=S7ZKP7_PENO1|nr:hypothetical protein PDE_06170 [Penicillium oxalicum 114-2]